MNIIPNGARAGNPAAQHFPTYFLQGSGDGFAVSKPAIARVSRKTTGVSATSYYGKVRTRVPYASALYAAAVAALLSACAQSDDVVPAPEAAITQPAGQADESASDIPTVVITASREHPNAIG